MIHSLSNEGGLSSFKILDRDRIVTNPAFSNQNTFSIWSLRRGEMLQTFEGHTEPILGVASVGQRYLASASNDQSLRVWDLETGRPVAVFTADAPLSTLAVVGDHGPLLVGDLAGQVHVLDLMGFQTGQPGD